MKPDTVTYNSVLGVWAASREPRRILKMEALLDKMKELHNDGDRSVKPDVVTYGIITNALSKSGGNLLVGEHVDKYLREMQHFHIYPNKKVYTNAIKAWTRSEDGKAKERISALKNAMGRLCV